MRTHRLIIRNARLHNEDSLHIIWEECTNCREQEWKIVVEEVLPFTDNMTIMCGSSTTPQIIASPMTSEDSLGLWFELTGNNASACDKMFVPWGNMWGEQSLKANKMEYTFFTY